MSPSSRFQPSLEFRKLIYIRFIWSNTNTSMPHFEQSFSDDGGKTWEVNWITDQTRVGDASAKARSAAGQTLTTKTPGEASGMQAVNSFQNGEFPPPALQLRQSLSASSVSAAPASAGSDTPALHPGQDRAEECP